MCVGKVPRSRMAISVSGLSNLRVSLCLILENLSLHAILHLQVRLDKEVPSVTGTFTTPTSSSQYLIVVE